MYAGNLNSLYQYKEMTTPYWQSDRQLCVEFYYTIIRPHEYSSTFLTIHQNMTQINVNEQVVVSKNMDVSEHKRLSNITLRHK
jgi:hypothetical protein